MAAPTALSAVLDQQAARQVRDIRAVSRLSSTGQLWEIAGFCSVSIPHGTGPLGRLALPRWSSRLAPVAINDNVRPREDDNEAAACGSEFCFAPLGRTTVR